MFFIYTSGNEEQSRKKRSVSVLIRNTCSSLIHIQSGSLCSSRMWLLFSCGDRMYVYIVSCIFFLYLCSDIWLHMAFTVSGSKCVPWETYADKLLYSASCLSTSAGPSSHPDPTVFQSSLWNGHACISSSTHVIRACDHMPVTARGPHTSRDGNCPLWQMVAIISHNSVDTWDLRRAAKGRPLHTRGGSHFE